VLSGEREVVLIEVGPVDGSHLRETRRLHVSEDVLDAAVEDATLAVAVPGAIVLYRLDGAAAPVEICRFAGSSQRSVDFGGGLLTFSNGFASPLAVNADAPCAPTGAEFRPVQDGRGEPIE
jgi:hypothetical protein